MVVVPLVAGDAMLQVIPDGCGDTPAGAALPRTWDTELLGRDLVV